MCILFPKISAELVFLKNSWHLLWLLIGSSSSQVAPGMLLALLIVWKIRIRSENNAHGLFIVISFTRKCKFMDTSREMYGD